MVVEGGGGEGARARASVHAGGAMHRGTRAAYPSRRRSRPRSAVSSRDFSSRAARSRAHGPPRGTCVPINSSPLLARVARHRGKHAHKQRENKHNNKMRKQSAEMRLRLKQIAPRGDNARRPAHVTDERAHLLHTVLLHVEVLVQGFPADCARGARERATVDTSAPQRSLAVQR